MLPSMHATQDPFAAHVAAEVPLPNAPLVRVIAQVRFPQVLSVEKPEFVAPFQEALRKGYPVLRPEQTRNLSFGPGGVSQSAQRLVWRFMDVSQRWHVSLASDFVAVQTTAYESRADFFTRLAEVLGALAEHVGPKTVDRVGVRYIDRMTGEALDRISALVRSEVLGLVGTPLARYVQHSLGESLFSVEGGEAQLLARWGRLPARGTVDPAAIEPLDEPSWILDLDMFRSRSTEFDAEAVVAEARSYAERVYTFFRWVVTDEFLRHYGGKT